MLSVSGMSGFLRFLDRKEVAVLLAHALIFPLVLAPLFLNLAPPFLDYHNHLARAYVIQNAASFADIYSVHWRIAPYVLSDMAYQAFASVFEIYTAGKLYIAFSFLLIAAGVLLISREVNGRISAATLLMYFFFFSLATILGLVNFIFGVGVALISFYLWLRLRRFSNPALLFVLFTLNFFVHAFSFACLVLIIGLHECLPHAGNFKTCLRRGFVVAGAAVPSMLLLFLSPRETMTAGSFLPGLESLSLAFAGPVAVTGRESVFLIAALPVLLVTGVLRPRRDFIWPLVALAAMALIVPHKLFGVLFVSIRIPVFLAFCVCAVSSFAPGRRVLTASLTGFFVLLALVNFGTLARMIDDCGKKYNIFVTELARITLEPQQSVQVINRDSGVCELGGDVFYFALAAVIQKHSFVPFLYTVMLPPIKPAGKYAALRQTDVQAIRYEEFLELPPALRRPYRYFLVMDQKKRRDFPVSAYRPIGGGAFFDLYENRNYINKAAPVKKVLD